MCFGRKTDVYSHFKNKKYLEMSLKPAKFDTGNVYVTSRSE